eukprot:SAG22_NODE_7146_length_771_cov_1.129464_1_plen_176_part_01
MAGGTDTSGAIRQTLCNLGVMVVACTAHVYAKPFAHTDSNVAEMATLFSTIMVLLVGLGTMKVQCNTDIDAQTNELKLAEEAPFGFYVTIYVTMGCFGIMTLAIITRRVGGAVGQMIRGAKRKWKDKDTQTVTQGLPDPIAKLISKDKHEAAIAWFNELEPLDEENRLVEKIGHLF